MPFLDPVHGLTTACRMGDYHRYLAEFASGEKRKGAATAAHDAYKVSAIQYMHNYKEELYVNFPAERH